MTEARGARYLMGTTVEIVARDPHAAASAERLASALDRAFAEFERLERTFNVYDSASEIDVIEEVARHHGYTALGRTLPRAPERLSGGTPAGAPRSPSSRPTIGEVTRRLRDAQRGTGGEEPT